MTNLLQHGTCVLDISSDEESAQRARREGREDKENVPPVDDVSQTARSQTRLRNRSADDMVVEKERVALGEMNTADFYAEGCDETSVILVPADDEEERQEVPQQTEAPPHSKKEQNSREPIVKDFEFAPEIKTLPSVSAPEKEAEPAIAIAPEQDFDMLMGRTTQASSSKAAVLQPIDGTGDSFELWESDSTKDENEAVPATAGSSS